MTTPSELGFRMPAEWEPHAATWMAWPYNLGTWEGHLDGAEQAFSEIIAALTPQEIVHLLVPNTEVEERAMDRLSAQPGIDRKRLILHTIETGDVWIRDYGPIFLVRGTGKKRETAWTKWIYNAYGNKYDDLLIGNDVPPKMPIQEIPHFAAEMILEGGSIDVNGSGSLLATESCLLSPDRNPHLTKEQIEQNLKDTLGVTNILWLAAGIAGDDTTGHVDDLTRFVGPSTVVTVIEEDPDDPNYKPLMENAKRLQYMKDENGTRLTVIPLPMPHPFTIENRRMAASYANFTVANGVVLVPTYDDPNDEEALKILRKCFPNRTVHGIDCRQLIWGYGSIHCATQQQPA